MILVSHPTGNQVSRHAAAAFAEVGRVAGFVTSLHVADDRAPWRWLPDSLRREAARRNFTEVGATVYPVAAVREATRLLAPRLGWKSVTEHERGWACVDQVYRAVDLAAAGLVARMPKLEAVYTYEDGALETFRAAKKHGVRCVYELPIGYWREHHSCNAQESQRRPDWAHTWSALADSSEKLVRKDEELALADLIVVASDFTRKSLRSYAGRLPPVVVIPYGCPPPILPEQREWSLDGPLKLLFVGGLSQRKGIADVIDAVSALKGKVEISIIGLGPGRNTIERLCPRAKLLGSMPHGQVLDQMRRHDVLMFPSLFEGFGLVITEAMAQGMVVVASDRTGLREVADEQCSFCVPAGSVEAMVTALEKLVSQRALLPDMGRVALQQAASWQWSHYQQRLRDVLQ